VATVIERCIWWPALTEARVHRDESLILKGPQPASRRPLPVSSASPEAGKAATPAAGSAGSAAGPTPPPKAPPAAPTHERIEVVHAPMIWPKRPFSPPLALYENDDVLLEHQDMNGRQPFYHRNTEVDEISYQVSGRRQLITDIGSVELVPGDFVKIPVGVSHDNWGREDIHLLFYVAAPVGLELAPTRFSGPHEFRDWTPAIVPEKISARSGAVDILTDEKLLLANAAGDSRKLEVAHADPQGERAGTLCIYRSAAFRLACVTAGSDEGRDYRRNLNFDEVQIQLRGTRTLITEVGCVALEPGDFVRIPAGIAHAAVGGACSYLQMQSAKPLRRLAEATKFGELRSSKEIDDLRAALA
jgi:uncharacterized cupin superfamily protein